MLIKYINPVQDKGQLLIDKSQLIHLSKITFEDIIQKSSVKTS